MNKLLPYTDLETKDGRGLGRERPIQGPARYLKLVYYC